MKVCFKAEYFFPTLPKCASVRDGDNSIYLSYLGLEMLLNSQLVRPQVLQNNTKADINQNWCYFYLLERLASPALCTNAQISLRYSFSKWTLS